MGGAGIGKSDTSALHGALLVAASSVAFSTAGYFTRLIETDVWTMLFWRGLSGGIFIQGFVVVTRRGEAFDAFRNIGRSGLACAACSTIATICFIASLRLTTVADVTVIYATAPLIAAGMAWVWTRERPSAITIAASLLAMAGVALMCGSAIQNGAVAGDLLALAMTALIALMMVIIRRNRHVSMVPASCLSAFACAAIAFFFAHPTAVSASTLGLLLLFGATQFGLGLLLLTLGSRHISATKASLLGNLELPLAPLWVWIAFGETPAQSAYFGGGVVVVALVMDFLGDTMRRR